MATNMPTQWANLLNLWPCTNSSLLAKFSQIGPVVVPKTYLITEQLIADKLGNWRCQDGNNDVGNVVTGGAKMATTM